MKQTAILIYLFSLSILCIGQTEENIIKAEHYKTRTFNVAIFPAEHRELLGSGVPFTPTREDIVKAELALKERLKEINYALTNQSSTPVIHENLKKYSRQYFGYINESGQRILLLNSFWTSRLADYQNSWLHGIIMVFDGGSYFWNIKYNLDTDELFELMVNGYA
jgi:hypothetical protein